MQQFKALVLSILICAGTVPVGAAQTENAPDASTPLKESSGSPNAGQCRTESCRPASGFNRSVAQQLTASPTTPKSDTEKQSATTGDDSSGKTRGHAGIVESASEEPGREIESEAVSPSADGAPAHRAPPSIGVLKGTVVHTLTPFKEDGSVETIKQGTPLNITLSANLNSELAQVGDQITAMVTSDVKGAGKVLLPGQWQVQGKVTQVQKRRRGGLDGYIEIKFEKLVSPDGKYEVPIDATVSTKDSAPKAIAKHLVKDAGFVSVGAIGGAILSVQTTGIPLAIATNGYTIAGGAALGATLGAVAAASRKGKILSALPGDELKLKISKEVMLPAFNPEALPSAAPAEVLEGVSVIINKSKKSPDPYGDKASCLLTVNFKFDNKTGKGYSFNDLAVISDHNHTYQPFASLENIREASKRVAAGKTQDGTITFYVGSPKHKYWLVLADRVRGNILTRVAIN